MALSEISYVERVLIVLNPDGTFKGAHAEQLREIRDGDKVLSAQQTTTPLTADALTTVLPDTATMLTSIKSIEAERDAALAAQDAAEKERDAAIAARDALQAQIDAAAAAAAEKARNTVSPYQARMALKKAGLFVGVKEMIEALPEDDDIRLAWDWAAAWERSSPFVGQLGAALGLTSEQIDGLFATAATF